MSLEADQVLERRRLKRHLTFWRLLAIFALVAVVVVSLGRSGALPGRDYVARLTVEGFIVDDPARDQALKDIAEDDNARALMVRIDSPGGTLAGGEGLFHSLRAVAKEKPVVAVMAGLATSAGYMTALGADHILAREGSVTGSIGVLFQTADVTGLLDKLGIKPETIKSGPLKAQPNPFEPFTEKAREVSKAVILDLFNVFVDMVAERRNLPREDVVKLADGRVFTGRQAAANKLIDEIGGEPEARKWLEETREIPASIAVRDVEIEGEGRYWLDLLTGSVGKALFSERLRLDGPIALWHPDLW